MSTTAVYMAFKEVVHGKVCLSEIEILEEGVGLCKTPKFKFKKNV